ncbi:chromosomal replication initiator protein DnaA [Candidatus Saccharibacteria bacterium]|nr:chromosomal replication initiator protein DnaA [Candidatus Saccharibacteria bacterium]
MFDVWQNVLAELEQTIPREAFATFFSNISLISNCDGVVVIGVSNVFAQSTIKRKYDAQVRKALENNEIKATEVTYEVKSAAKVRPRGREVSLEEVRPSIGRAARGSRVRDFSSGLNPDYTMANFVPGTSNELAVNVAKNIIKSPGKNRFNPFFLYGGPGLGKSHLVQAVGNEIVRRNPNLKVLYTTTNNFYSEFIKSIKSNKGDSFAKKYRNLDVLIIDDFQAIMKKDASQEEFFNTFNDLYQRNKQVIVTSDRLPDQIKTIDARLASRLAWRGPIDLQMPSFEERCAILKMKAELQGYDLEDEVVEFIADNVRSNIRELEGELNKVLLYADLKQVTPLEVINNGMVTNKRAERRGSITAKQIVSYTAKACDLTVTEMCGKSRVAHIKTARQIAMYLLSEELEMSTPKIALEVGVKDHTTVMHGIKKIRNDLKLDFKLREKLEEIREKLYV